VIDGLGTIRVSFRHERGIPALLYMVQKHLMLWETFGLLGHFHGDFAISIDSIYN